MENEWVIKKAIYFKSFELFHAPCLTHTFSGYINPDGGDGDSCSSCFKSAPDYILTQRKLLNEKGPQPK